ncbi:MAG: amidase family protein [Paracoccaceae bacterium]|nr:amidase family protein [Paracoccaceae bacterium]
MKAEWAGKTAADLGRAIEAGEADPVELTQAFLDEINAHPLRNRIYARLTEERALSEAAAASERARSGHRLSPLDGVPISWKDLYDTAGVATEAGSALLAGRVPDSDAQVLSNATKQGLICLGKTHMSELAFSGLGYNPITETPPSVNDPDAVAGGSSSGAAASVAFGLAAAGIGSDTGGSVRIPSVWNDLVGLKTTHGRLSLEGVVPLCERFDTVGPLCRSVEDAALVMAAMTGEKSADLSGASLADTRLLIPENVAMDDLAPEVAAGFTSAVERLQNVGAKVERREIPAIEKAMKLTAVLFAAEAYGTWQAEIEAAPHKMFPEILERFRGGARFAAWEFVRAWQDLTSYRVEWLQSVSGYDAVILPTCPILPPKIERLKTDHDYYVSNNLAALRNTRIGNLMGLTALTIPTGVPSTGLMMMTPPSTDERLLRLGAAAEAALS